MHQLLGASGLRRFVSLHSTRPTRIVLSADRCRSRGHALLRPLSSGAVRRRLPTERSRQGRTPLGHDGIGRLTRRLFGYALGGVPSHDDTIFALSTAPGRAAIAVIRISGPACLDVYKALCPGRDPPKPRVATVRTLYSSTPTKDAIEATVLDPSALILYFPAPRSATGEDVLELHVHGGPATVRAVLAALPTTTTSSSPRLASTAVIRHAEPGEFTRRAFLRGRLDLAQVESLAATLSAETEHQRLAAARGASGALGKRYDAWQARLLGARAELEALIDFAEDQALETAPGGLWRRCAVEVRAVADAVARYEEGAARASLVREGARVVVLGRPNAGKSSLLNRVVGREASIVTDVPGTTRDVVEVRVDLRGWLCTVADTAGIRRKGKEDPNADGGGGGIDVVEREGIRRAVAKARDADLVVVLASVEAQPNGGGVTVAYDPETLELAARSPARLVVINKRDRVPDPSELAALVDGFTRRALNPIPELRGTRPLVISCAQAASADEDADFTPSGPRGDRSSVDPGGVSALVDAVAEEIAGMTSLPPEMQDLVGATERQRVLLAECREHLDEFLAHVREDDHDRGREEPDVVVAAEHLRYAARCLARITGRGEAGDVEEVLGVIFEKFCVGK